MQTLKKNKTVLSNFLQELHVEHTDEFSQKLYNEHPHKYNLFGLSKMLAVYQIENVALKVENKEESLPTLEAPFIAHIGTDFVIVSLITQEKVEYIWKGKIIKIPIHEFIQKWTGVVLLAEPNNNSIEPNQKENNIKGLFKAFQKLMLLGSICFLLFFIFILNSKYTDIGIVLLLVVNIIGAYVGYLLLLKQMRIQSTYADKVCSLLKQGDCNDILEADAAKIMGVISWSEIGLGYFISNILLVLITPQFISYLAVVNLCALPYSLWSIWYQKIKAKQWCVLCLIVQSILWCIFFFNIFFGFISIPILHITSILSVFCIYSIPLLAINLVQNKLTKGVLLEGVIQELNSIKVNEDVFSILLKKQSYYKVDKDTSAIQWGNLNADILVTIITNPHCDPCATMHNRVEKLLSETNNLCIQYIFTSFSSDMDFSNKFLNAIYLNYPKAERIKIFRDWFGRKMSAVDFFKTYHLEIGPNAIREFEKHESWKREVGLQETPIILVNGYLLPDNYKLEDLTYMTSLNL